MNEVPSSDPHSGEPSDASRNDESRSDEPRGEEFASLSPFPNQRDLYVVLAGAVLGLLLSQAVLGVFAPDVYERLFVGGVEAKVELEQKADELAPNRDLLEEGAEESWATQEAQRLQAELKPFHDALQQARAEHMDWLQGRMMALVLAIVVMMLLEAVVSPQVKPGQAVIVPRALNRLITIRYALIALWVAVIIAQPQVLANMPWVFWVLLIIVAMIVAFIPLGRRGSVTPS